ncbi:MAG: hypothetical protein IPF82_18845 [Blastocatellia bacterium]|nr:hypothetical protein [Blastocatellia bacterium]
MESSAKKSTGCIIAAVVGGFFVVAAVLLVVLFGFGYYAYRGGPPAVNNTPMSGSAPTGGSSGSSSAPSASGESPSPTPGQQAAIAGGTETSWEGQGITWTLPKGWSKQSVSPEMFSYKSPGTWDAGWITVSISVVPDSIPTDVSLNAMHQAALDQQKLGKYTEVRWLVLDGVRGVQFLEKSPDDSSDVQRLQWQAYRSYNGQKQLINLMVHSSGKGFPTHVDALYGILYSTKLTK